MILKCLIPIILKILNDDNFDLKELLIPKIVEMGSDLKKEDLENIILTSNCKIFSKNRYFKTISWWYEWKK